MSKNNLAAELAINPEFVLYMLDLPISFHRAYIPITGKVTAALMLSWSVQISEEYLDSGGWFAKTNEEWSHEIGLSRDELSGARKCLQELGLLEIRRESDQSGSMRRVNHYRVNFERLSELLLEQAHKLRRPSDVH